jgi:hypothetical protein
MATLVPSLVNDKYAALEALNGASTQVTHLKSYCRMFAQYDTDIDEHMAVWLRVLRVSRGILATGTTLFVDSDRPCVRQVCATVRGRDYLSAVAQVYRVVCRVRVSLKTTSTFVVHMCNPCAHAQPFKPNN